MNALGKTYSEIAAQTKVVTLPFRMKAYQLPPPRKLSFDEVVETGSRYRPFLDARISRGFWLWQRFEDVSIFRRG